MATDCFLKIDSIAGESTDDKHKGEIELVSYSLGAKQAAMVATSGVGGATGARVDLSELSIRKVLDVSSPNLFKFCCTGKHISTMTLTVCAANEDKHPYYVIKFTDVVVSSVKNSGPHLEGANRPAEDIGFRYGKVEITYTPYDATGKKGSDAKAGWDAEKNVAV